MSKDALPIYKISIDPSLAEDGETLGISQVAYTKTPAILTKGIYFDTIDKLTYMRFSDELKMRVAAPVLIPDMPIYRNDDDLGEYSVVFTKDTIELLRQNFMLSKGKNAFNLDHTDQETPSYILDSWITGPSATDLSFTKYGVTVPEGSWFVVSQFTDKEYFQNEIVAKDRVGYSIEGFLGLALSQIIKKEVKQNIMEKQKFEKAILDDGTVLFVSKAEVGGDVMVIDDNGDKAPIFDGEHKLKDGSTLVTVSGKITEIKPAADGAPVAAEATPVEAEVTPVEAAVGDPVTPATIDEAAIMAIVQPKLDELYKVIAEI